MDAASYLAGFERAEKIERGMAGDEKYRCLRDGQEYLLRIADGSEYEEKEREYLALARLNRAGLPVPQCVEFQKIGDKVFTLLSWIPGEEAETTLPDLRPEERYRLGLQAGEILRGIHENAPVTDEKDWYTRYFEVIDPRLEAFRQEGVAFEGSQKILDFLEDNKHLLKTRPLCRHHGDYHTGNLIVRDGRIWVIDWHTMDFDSVGDPWYEFNRADTEYPDFARGQIDGYFGTSVPEAFWRLFALYLSVSAITSIVWAKYRAPDRFDSIMKLNRDVLFMFDDMENPIPKWYRE